MIDAGLKSDKLEDVFHGLLPFEDDEVDQAYLKYLEKGSLPNSGCAPKKVLIIGCGIAGMVTATMLRRAGHAVTIVEANNRVGGRCKTFRNTPEKKYFSDDELTGEAGAMRIPDIHKLVQFLIKDTGVEKQLFLNDTVSRASATSPDIDNPKRNPDGTIELPKGTGKNFLHVNYHHALRSEYNKPDVDIRTLLGYDLGPTENVCAGDLMVRAIGNLREAVLASPKTMWPQVIARFGEYSMRRFLKEVFPAFSDPAVDYIGVVENVTSRMAYSFIQSFIELAIIKPDTAFWLIKGGTDKLTQAYYEQQDLEDVTVLNQTVIDLYRDEKSGKVCINTNKSDADEDTLDGGLALDSWDEVVVTIPFSAFRMVHVWPGFSEGKQRAVRELHYDAATKVLLEFKERFWERDNDIYGGGSITDLPNRYMYYPSERMGSSGGGLMLVSYSWADDARRWDSMTPYERYCYALNNVAITHAIHEPDAPWKERKKAQQKIKDLCVFNPKDYNSESTDIIGGATVSWMSNPYAYGEAAIFYPGQLALLHKHIVQSEWENKDGRCIAHFAGEHASMKHAWIEGAIESAMNAALVVNQNELPTLTHREQ